jgi:hypothetical protein
MRVKIVAVLLALTLPSCGDEDAPTPADAGGPDGGCAPRSAMSFSPAWKPPQATLNACTDAQIDAELTHCESASGSVTECRAFNRDPANAPCRTCLYSTGDESTYGPLIYLRNRVLTVNVPGCLALADGQLGATGCGAHLQAYESCKDAVCIQSCATYDAYVRCVNQAGNTVCEPYLDDSACGDPATYAPCLDNATFEDFFRNLAKIFCGSGFPGGGGADGGRPGDGGADGGAADVASRPTRIPSTVLHGLERAAVRSQVKWGIGEGLRR